MKKSNEISEFLKQEYNGNEKDARAELDERIGDEENEAIRNS